VLLDRGAGAFCETADIRRPSSLLTAIFLPITLITGIFGMNVGGLPGVDRDTGFAWVIGLMILTVVTSLVLLHWRRFF
jgi:zinc transporter